MEVHSFVSMTNADAENIPIIEQSFGKSVLLG